MLHQNLQMTTVVDLRGGGGSVFFTETSFGWNRQAQTGYPLNQQVVLKASFGWNRYLLSPLKSAATLIIVCPFAFLNAITEMWEELTMRLHLLNLHTRSHATNIFPWIFPSGNGHVFKKYCVHFVHVPTTILNGADNNSWGWGHQGHINLIPFKNVIH